MSNHQLFQYSVLDEFVNKQDENLIKQRWEKFQNFLSKQEYIENVKEEKYQDGFLKDIFEECLGYTLDSTNPNSYNLEREKKNKIDGKKADGAIVIDNHVVGIIELKGQNTKELDKKGSREQSTVDQAFGYLYSHDSKYAKYVIVSNFNEVRFYIKDKTDYERFFLFQMKYEEFKKFHTILSYESIKAQIPLQIKEKSVTFEVDISNKFYKDYTKFRTELFENIIKNNPNKDQYNLLNATQKLIDRIVFILFGEDTGLLPLNTIPTIIKEYKEQRLTDYSLYDVYKIYFQAIDKGNSRLEIDRYNGGLFASDDYLDSLIIDSEVLDTQAKILSAYKFGNDISVNILGHIFEQSISDLEEITAQIENKSFDKRESKRKKDGVFYTPAYITKYIVDNTLGKLCEEKKKELDIIDIEIKKGTRAITKDKINKNLESYKEWLLSLKILDPACGSGAFLNQALEFLIEEHNQLQREFAKLGNILFTYEVEKSILENNLYGVDINTGAVEIAKLSLWLRTASRGRSLTSLADKIKVGNSLIDDKSVVDNAFVWEEEFSEVFEQGGFDVVIGNPPYGAKLLKEHQNFMKNKYDIGSTDTAPLFIKLSNILLKDSGVFSFIIPKSFSFSSSYTKIRDLIWNDLYILVDCGKVWNNVKLEQNIFVSKKNVLSIKYNSLILKEQNFISIATIDKNIAKDYGFFLNSVSDFEINLANKMRNDSLNLNDISINRRGATLQKFIKKEADLNVIGGAEIDRNGIKGYKGQIYIKDITKEQAKIKKNSILVQNLVAHIMNPIDHIKIIACIPNDFTVIILDTINQIMINSEYKQEYIWILLNSKLINWYVYRFIYAKAIRTMHFDNSITSRIPIKELSRSKEFLFIEKANKILELNLKFSQSKQNFLYELELEKIPKKLQNFQELDFNNFIKEYKKAKQLKFANKLEERNFKNEWIDLFEHDKKVVTELQAQIDATDREIDQMVYKLYGLTEDEVALVEGR